jgi:hypothetical protein
MELEQIDAIDAAWEHQQQLENSQWEQEQAALTTDPGYREFLASYARG